jgi:tetratricopeptide (TPR) repeat protein
VLLIGGVIGTSAGMLRAQSEAHNAQTILAFVEGLLSEADPWSARTPDLTVREALADAEQRMAALDLDPLVEARIRESIGSVYRGLGLAGEAERYFRDALELRRRAGDERSSDALRSMLRLSLALSDQNRLGEAESLSREVLEIHAHRGREDEITYLAHAYLANALSEARRAGDALVHARAALEGFTRLYGDDDPRTLTRMSDLGMAYMDFGELAQAERMLRRAVEGRRRRLGPEAPDTLISLDLLAIVLSDLGRDDEARAAYEEAVGGLRAALGSDHFATLRAEHNFAMFLLGQGSLEQAETLARSVLERRRRVLDPGHDDLLSSANCLARIELARERFGPARTLFKENLDAIRAKYGPRHLFIAHTMRSIAKCDEGLGELERAAEEYNIAISQFKDSLPDGHRHVLTTSVEYGDVLQRMRRFEDAESVLLGAFETSRDRFGVNDELTQSALHSLVELYEGWGRRDRATAFRSFRAES